MQKEKRAAETAAVMNKLATQEKKVEMKSFQFTPVLKFSMSPTPTVAPTWHWVVDTGMERTEAMVTMNAVDSSMEKPREGVTLTIFMPRAMITSRDGMRMRMRGTSEIGSKMPRNLNKTSQPE
jgi:hypothetical protein